MQPELRDPAHLWHAVRAGRELLGFVAGLTFEQYIEKRALTLAVERDFEILGEAVRKISEALRAAHPGIPWSRMIALRNIVAHRYYAVDHALLWQIMHEVLPAVLDQLEQMIPPLPPEIDE
jgi:uncharacterized protein with HEPN domain